MLAGSPPPRLKSAPILPLYAGVETAFSLRIEFVRSLFESGPPRCST